MFGSYRGCELIGGLDLWGFEDEFEGCDYCDGLAVYNKGSEAPGFHCLGCCVADIGGSVEGASAGYSAVGGDGGLDVNGTVDGDVTGAGVDGPGR